MVLPPLNIRYPYDPTGNAKSNYVAGERHTLPPVNQRIIVPKLGAFYANSLIVRYNNQELIRGVDYELAAIYHDATVATGQDVNVMIYFGNKDIVGDVELYYQVVGGQFTGIWESIQQYVNVLLVDPRKVRWDDIANKPEQYAPKDHFHDINDVYGLNHLIPKLEEIRAAILRIRTKEFRKLYDRFLQIKKDVEAAIDNITNVVHAEVDNVIRNNDQMTLVQNSIRDITARLVNLEGNTSVQSELVKLKAKDTELTNNFNNFKTSVTEFVKLDPKTTNIIKRSSAGLLAELKLSTAKGNLLSIMSDGGLYYGIEPPADIKYIYVDAERGSDSNKGTIAEPFRTIKKAIEFSDSIASRNILLYEGQNHVVDKLTYIKSYRLFFRPYGPIYNTIPGDTVMSPYSRTECYNLNTRITFVPDPARVARSPMINVSCLINNSGSTTALSFAGLKIIVDKHPEDHLFNTPTDYDPNVKYRQGYRSSIIADANFPVNLHLGNCGLFFVDGVNYKVGLYSGNTSITGAYVCHLNLRELSGDGVICKNSSYAGSWQVDANAYGTNKITDLFPDTATFNKYFPNVWLDTSGIVYPTKIVGIPKDIIPINARGQVYSSIAFYNSSPINNTIRNYSMHGASITFNGNGKFYISKPLMNSDNHLLAVSPDSNNAIETRNNGLYVAPPVSYDTLSRLPEKTWSKGTSILSKDANGNWYRMVPPDALYQDIGVTLTADKYSNTFDVGVTTHVDFRVKCTVTNSQVAKNTVTELTLILPKHSSESPYEVLDYNYTLNKGERVEKVSDTLYRIYGLANGGSMILTFTLRATNFGSYQIGAQVTVNASVDTNSTNNTSNITLTAVKSLRLVEQPKEDVNYATSVDCPMIIASNADTGERYYMLTTDSTGNNLDFEGNLFRINKIDFGSNYDVDNGRYNSIIKTIRVKLENCSSFIYYTSVIDTYDGHSSYGGSLFQINDGVPVSYYKVPRSAEHKYALNVAEITKGTSSVRGITTDWDSANSILTIRLDHNIGAVVLYCRPKGANCKWQAIAFSDNIKLVNSTKPNVIIDGIPANRYEYTKINIPINVPPVEATMANYKYIYLSPYNNNATKRNDIGNIGNYVGWPTAPNVLVKKIYKGKLTITLPKNTKYNFTINYNNTDMVYTDFVHRSGNLDIKTISTGIIRVTTTNAVSESDNVILENFQLRFV